MTHPARRRTLLKAAGAMLAVPALPVAAAALVHPGLLHTQADISRMATQVAAGAQPWQAGWAKLTVNAHAASTWTPTPLATVYRGAGTPENHGTLYNDVAAAYQNALRYRVTGIASYGNTARNILNAWSATLTTIDGTADKYLTAGLCGYQLANAAELMRGYSGFDLARFQTMLRAVFYPLSDDFLRNHNGAVITNYWAGWDLCNTAAILAIGVVCDDQAKIDQATAYYRTGAGNGSLPHAVPYVYAGRGLAQAQESGRDQGHTMLSIGLMATVCEMAWNQGIDLYGLDDNRFLKAAEYVARYNLGEEVPYTTYTWVYGQPGVWGGTEVQTVISPTGRGGLRPIWEMIYHHYTGRRGLAAPNVAAYARRVRPEGGGGDYGSDSGGYDHLGFGTLTATRSPAVTLPAATRSFQSANHPARWIRHRDGLGYVDPVDTASDAATKQSAVFTVVPGLADTSGYSLRTTTGLYLRHAQQRLRVAADDGTTGFDADATFHPVAGAASGTVRLMSHNLPGRCIRHRGFELWLDPCAQPVEDAGFQADSSFAALNPWT